MGNLKRYSLNDGFSGLHSERLGVDVNLVKEGLSLHDGNRHHLLDLAHRLVEDLGVHLLDNLVGGLLLTLVEVLADLTDEHALLPLYYSLVHKFVAKLFNLLGVENVELLKVLVENIPELLHLKDLGELGIVSLAQLDEEVLLDPLRHHSEEGLLELF